MNPTMDAEGGIGAEPVMHHAFISYQRSSSQRAARLLQDKLEGIARRSDIEPKLDLYRDETRLVISDLDRTLQDEIERSRRLIVLLHEETRNSPWVEQEVEHWLAAGGAPDRLILARIDPTLDLTWDAQARRFVHGDALPRSLRSAFSSEPLWVDLPLRWGGRFDDSSSQLARLCATLVERDPADILQREVQAERRRKVRLIGGMTALAVLLVITAIASVVAVDSRNSARANESEAIAKANANEALLVGSDRPEHAIVLLVDAASRSKDRAVRSSIFAVLEQSDRLIGVLQQPDTFDGDPPDDVSFSPSGTRLLGWRLVAAPSAGGTPSGGSARPRIAVAVWDMASKRVVQQGIVDGTKVEQASVLGDDRLVFCGEHGVEMITMSGVENATEETLIAGTDSCMVEPMRNGVFTLIRPAGKRAEAVVLGVGDERTHLTDVRYAASNARGDVAFVSTASGDARAISADGSRSIELTGLSATTPNKILSFDATGTLMMSTQDGRLVRARALTSDPSAHYVDKADGAVAVAPVRAPDGSSGLVWLTASGQLRWSLSDASLDLRDQGSSSKTVERREPALWVDESGSTAVAAFSSRAVVVGLTTRAPSPSMTLGTTMAIDPFGQRSEVMTPMERGRTDVLLPGADKEFNLVRAGGRTETGKGAAFFDPTGRVAVSFGSGPLRLFSNDFPYSQDLSAAADVTSVAFSPTGDRLAVVAPTGAVTVYTTASASDVSSLVEASQRPWRSSASFGNAQVRNDGTGRLTFSRGGQDAAPFDRLSGQLRGAFGMKPDGTAVVGAVIPPGAFASGGQDDVTLIGADGDAVSLAGCRGKDQLLKFLPGKEFRGDVQAAERQELVWANSPTDGDSVPVCADGANGDGLARPDSVLDYQIDGAGGRILARREDGAIDLTTWVRGNAASLRSIPIPSTTSRSSASMGPSSDAVAVWRGGGGSISIRRLVNGAWDAGESVSSDIGDVVAALPDVDADLVTVVGAAGTLEVFDLESGRMLFRRPLKLSLTGYSEGARVRWASAKAENGRYVIDLGVGRETGAVTDGYRVEFPLDVDVLRERLCDINPFAEHC